MKTRQSFTSSLTAYVLLALICVADAGVIPANRITDWTPGVSVGVPGGIPHRTTIGANVKDFGAVGDGTTDDTPSIISALAACPAGQVLYFPPGTYKLLSRINATRSNVTWRGAGMGQTVILPYSSDYIYCGNSDWPYHYPSNNITSGATAGSTQLTVDTVNNISVGSLITITQTNPPWVHANTNYYGAGPGWCGHDANRLMAITVKVTAINNNVVTIEHPLPIDMTNAPMITPWHYVTAGDGFEDMTFDLANGGGSTALFFAQAYGCWVKNVEIEHATSRFLWFDTCVNCEVRECYTHSAIGGGPNHEGIDFYLNCCYNLIEDNICVQAGAPMIILGDWGGGDVGNVIGYNLMIDAQSGSSVAGNSLSLNHGPHNMFNLVEGNVGQSIASDGYYGGSSHATLYRNYFSGAFTNFMWPQAVHLGHWEDYDNLVGNVFGAPGYAATSQETNNGYSGSEAVIYVLGYPNPGNVSFAAQAMNPAYFLNYDLNVQSTMLRTGNYNYLDGTTTWDTNGVQSLPASLYYTSQPAWWTNSAPWPAMGPDVANNVQPIPAVVRYYNVGMPTTQTPTNSTPAPPAPPTNLSAQAPVANSSSAPSSTSTGTSKAYVAVSASPVDWVGNWSKLSQSFTPTATVQITAIKANLQNVNSASAHFEIRTASNGAGSKLGASTSIAPKANAWNTFAFSSPVQVPAGTTVYLTYVSDQVDFWYLANDTTATGQAFNGSSPADSGNYDWCIEVDTQ